MCDGTDESLVIVDQSLLSVHGLGRLTVVGLHQIKMHRAKFYKRCLLRTDRLHGVFWTVLLSIDDDDNDDDDCIKTLFRLLHKVVDSIF